MPCIVTFAGSSSTPTDAPAKKDEDCSRSVPQQSTTPATITTIVDEAQECLALSNLMFLYADLRLLSATGRVNTKFESLCIDSDRVPKTTSAEMAQLEGIRIPRDIASTNDACEGVTPAQIMAILFVELRQEVLAQRRRVKERLRKGRGWVPKALTTNEDDEDDDVDDGGLLDKITDSEGRKELEMDMHANIRAYNDMLAHDLRGMPAVQVENIVVENIVQHAFRKSTGWFTHSYDAAEFDEEGSKNSTCSAPERFNKPAIFGVSSPNVKRFNKSQLPAIVESESRNSTCSAPGRFNMPVIFGVSSSNVTRFNKSQLSSTVESEPHHYLPAMETKSEDYSEGGIEIETRGHEHSNGRMNQPDLFGNNEIVKGTRADRTDPAPTTSLLSKQGRNDALKKQFTTYVKRVKEDRALQHKLDDYEAFAGAEDVGNKVLTMTSKIYREASPMPGRTMSEKELLDFMTKCIESRDSRSLDFMAEFFKDDTVAQAMVKSEAQFVWLQDWFPIKDCIYAISVDKRKKRVAVVFRGAITRADWSHAGDFKTKRCDNPVSESYAGKEECLRIHRGFYMYLFRGRKDTFTTKYDEIATKVYEYGNKMIGSDFTVAVNGFSLGGALSLLFGFFASTDKRFTQNGPVQIFTYGMPLMASNAFADAFRHQEKSRKVQHARFYNSNDVVPHVPLNLKPTKRGSRLVHVGIDVKLYPAPRFVSFRGNRHPLIHYNDQESAMGAYWRALKNNVILIMPFPWRIKRLHALPEHRKRLARAMSKAEADKVKATKPFLHSTLDEAYDAMVYRKGD